MALVGASMQATRIIPSGNFPAIAALGTYAHGLNGVMIENLSVVCAGMAKSEAMGVRLAYVNRGVLQNLYFNGCRHALDLYDQWQTRIQNVTADGRGEAQNAVGVYMGSPGDPANPAPNNAVIMSDSTMQNVAEYGYQLTFFAGSKFFNDEAMDGITGWKLCGAAYALAGQACQFGHFYNILADTTSGPGIVVDQGGNANPVVDVMFDHVWIGSSSGHGLYVAGVKDSQFDNVHVTRADNGVYLHNSANVKVSVNVAGYNRHDNGSHAAVIDGGQDNTLWATDTQSDHANGYNGVVEMGPTQGNAIRAGLADCRMALVFGDAGGGLAPHAAPAGDSCRYEVLDRQVRVTFHLQAAGPVPAGAQAWLTGLPFATDRKGAQESVVGNVLIDGARGLEGTVVALGPPGSRQVGLYTQGVTGKIRLTGDNFLSSSSVSGVFTYTRD